jgi:hypothetical protein
MTEEEILAKQELLKDVNLKIKEQKGERSREQTGDSPQHHAGQ